MPSVGAASSKTSTEPSVLEPPQFTPSTKPTEKKPAVALEYVPTQPGPSNVVAFFAAQTQAKVSPGCAQSVDSGASPATMAATCSAKEFVIAADLNPQKGAVPVEADSGCIQAWDDAGQAIAEAAGEEVGSRIKKSNVPVLSNLVAKQAKKLVEDDIKLAVHKQAIAQCKTPTNAQRFVSEHFAPKPNGGSCPVPQATSSEFTPADPAKAVCK
jgi:hypothetical protein